MITDRFMWRLIISLLVLQLLVICYEALTAHTHVHRSLAFILCRPTQYEAFHLIDKDMEVLQVHAEMRGFWRSI